MFGSIIFSLSAILLHFTIVSGSPKPGSPGVGAYAYQDTAGNRYGGTFDLKDGDFAPFAEKLFPDYFTNLQSLFDEWFQNMMMNQRLQNGYDMAMYPYGDMAMYPHSDMTWNIPDFLYRFPGGIGGFGYQPGFGNTMPGYGNGFGPGFGNIPGMNSAYAGSMAAPGFVHQYAGVNPQNPGNNFLVPMREQFVPAITGFSDIFPPINWHHGSSSFSAYSSFPAPNMQNVDVTNRFAETDDGKPHVYSVQSSAFSSSSNVNGKETSVRKAHTKVNNDGKVTEYEVHN